MKSVSSRISKRSKQFPSLLAVLAAIALTACGGGSAGNTSTAPPAPTGITAVKGNAQVTVSWIAVTGATSYNVYYKTTADVTTGNGTKVAGATSPKTITSLVNGTTYYFVITAMNTGGESAVSSEVSATPQVPIPPPAAPTGITPAAGNARVTISWTSSAATSYNLYYGTAPGVVPGGAGVTAVLGAVSPYVILSLTNGTTYYFALKAVNAGGESAVSSEVSATPVQKVPDTGQTACYDSAGSVLACAGTGQDGAYTINPPSYADNGDGTVTDNVTGLMWQQQDDAKLRDWAGAVTYCTDLLSLPYSDWRLPSVVELQSIVNYGMFTPSTNATYFPATQWSYYWSSTDYWPSTDSGPGSYPSAWCVDFTNGHIRTNKKNYFGGGYFNVRCVRLGQSMATPKFTDNGDGTITDKVTTLMWQKQDDGTTRDWATALTYCEGLTLGGNSDWRLPNVKELRSIVDYTGLRPTINATYFPATQSLSPYWSSTTYAYDTTSAWYVNFSDGYVGSVIFYGKTPSYYVRCVRLGQ